MTPPLGLSSVCAKLGGRMVLQDVTFEVQAGEVLGVLGANGGGKTTLLRAALGLTPLAGGEARLAGRSVGALDEATRARHAAYLPQSRQTVWNLPAWRIVALGAPRSDPMREKPAAIGLLDELGVGDLAERGVLDMSGGERARVLVARLLHTGAPLLVADEPIAGLDPDSQFLVMDRLRARADRGAAVLVSLHDLTIASRYCDRLAVLKHGRLIALGSPTEALTPGMLSAAFGLEGDRLETPWGVVVAGRRGR